MQKKGTELKTHSTTLGLEVILTTFGIIGVYAALFGVGNFIYGNWVLGISLSVLAIVCLTFVIRSITTKMQVE